MHRTNRHVPAVRSLRNLPAMDTQEMSDGDDAG